MSEQSVHLCMSSRKGTAAAMSSQLSALDRGWAMPRWGSSLGPKLAGCCLLHL